MMLEYPHAFCNAALMSDDEYVADELGLMADSASAPKVFWLARSVSVSDMNLSSVDRAGMTAAHVPCFSYSWVQNTVF